MTRKWLPVWWRRRSVMDLLIVLMVVCGAGLGMLEVVGASQQRLRGIGLQQKATQSSIAALAALEAALVNAGAGLVAGATHEAGTSVLGCPLLLGAQAQPIAPIVVQAGRDDAESDVLTLMAGASAGVPTPIAVLGLGSAEPASSGARTLRLASVQGLAVGDLLLVHGRSAAGAAQGPPQARCALVRIARIGLGPWHDAGQWTSAGMVAVASALPAELEASWAIHLGAAPQFVRLRIDERNQLVAEDLLSPGAPRRMLASSVGGLRVQLGIDADRDGVVDRWLNPAGEVARQAMLDGRVSALRVGVQARQPDGDASSAEHACVEAGPERLLDSVDGEPQGALPAMPASAVLTSLDSARCYRYAVASAVVPLRNITVGARR